MWWVLLGAQAVAQYSTGRWVRDPRVIEKLILESIEYMGRVTNVSIETLSLRHG